VNPPPTGSALNVKVCAVPAASVAANFKLAAAPAVSLWTVGAINGSFLMFSPLPLSVKVLVDGEKVSALGGLPYKLNTLYEKASSWHPESGQPT
jgi:hypothetical protein